MELTLRKAHAIIKQLENIDLGSHVKIVSIDADDKEDTALAFVSMFQTNAALIEKQLLVKQLIFSLRSRVQTENSTVLNDTNINELLNEKEKLTAFRSILKSYGGLSTIDGDAEYMAKVSSAIASEIKMYGRPITTISNVSHDDYVNFRNRYYDVVRALESITEKLSVLNNSIKITIHDGEEEVLKSLRVI